MSASESNSEIVLELAEEFLARYRAGERPPLREYIERHPELAAEIREVFPAMAMMENIALNDESLEAEEAHGRPSVGTAVPLQQLGDFRIIREVGKGGMGIVYEAEQVSLGRHVALKVLPKKMLLDAKQKRRFEREAKAAAKLHHTNIVPVFGVGEHEGMPYYVMQFIQGLGLDEVLDELRRIQKGPAAPTAESGARNNRGDVTAADVARSLLTGAFENSLPLTADGPVPIEEPAVSDSAPTPRIGQLSDTFSLSSSSAILPGGSESLSKSRRHKSSYWQSVANIGRQVANALDYAHSQGILHRDIKPSNLLLDNRGTVWVADFGLAKAEDQQNLTNTGDILGTLRYMPPEAFEGRTDRRGDVYSLGVTLYELVALQPAFDEKDRHRLIKRVTSEEPERLDRVNRQIPRDLVTIVHKAIDRDPAHRYSSAAALAADLQRFLDDEPILARRTSHRERFRRWVRHHPGVAGLTAALFLLLFGVALAAIGVAAHFDSVAKAATDAAANERDARRLEREAKDEQAKLHKEAEQALQEAKAQHARAEANFAKARAVVNDYFTRVSESQLLQVPGMQPLRAELLNSARKFYEDFAKERTDDPELTAELAATFDRIGLLHADLGNKAEGRKAYEQAIQRYEKLLESSPPNTTGLQDRLAASWQGLGDLEYTTKRVQAQQSYVRCVAIREALVKAHPANTEYRKDLARAYNGLGLTGPNIQAQFEAYRRSLEIRLDLLNVIPDDPRVLHGLSESFNNIGQLVSGRGYSEEALAMYRSGLDYGRRAYERAPHVVEFALDYAVLNFNVANSARLQGRRDEMLAAVRTSVQHIISYLRANPVVVDMQQALFNHLAGSLSGPASADQARVYVPLYKEARSLFAGLPKRTPDDHLNAARAKVLYGRALERWEPSTSDAERAAVQSEFDGAVEDIRRAVAAGLPDSTRLTSGLFMPITTRQDFKDLVAEVKKPRIADVGKPGATTSHDSPAALAARRRQAEDRAAALLGVGLLQIDFHQTEAGERTLEQARAALEALIREDSDNIGHRAALARLQLAIGRAHWKAGRSQEAAAMFAKTAESIAAALKTGEVNGEFAGVSDSLAGVYGQLGLWEEAATLHRRALTRQGDPQARWPWSLAAHYCLLQGDREGFNKIAVAMAKSPDSAETHDMLIRTLTLVPDPPVPPSADQLMKWAEERAKQARTNSRNRNFHLAWAYYRAGKYEEALVAARGDEERAFWYRPVVVMATFQLGRVEEARRLLDQADQWYVDAFRHARLDRGLELPRDLIWEDWLRFHLERKEAHVLVTGESPPDIAWWHLYQGRLNLALGRTERADAEFQAAVATGPDDPSIWLARGRIYEERGQADRAKADFAKALDLKSSDGRPWIDHGHFLVERGRNKDADEAYAKAAAAALTELHRFLEAGWWAVGPFSGPLEAPSAVEERPDPAVPVNQIRWQRISPDPYGQVNLAPVFNTPKDSHVWALAHVYSPNERTALLHVGGVNRLRCWLNGNLIHEPTKPLDWVWGTDRVPVTLRPGRNTLLVKVSRAEGGHLFSLRLGDDPASRGFALAEMCLWKEAADAWKPLFAESLPTDHFLWPQYGLVLRLIGDEDGYRRLCESVLRQVGTVTNPWQAENLLWLLTLSNDPVRGADNLLALCRGLYEESSTNPQESWRHPAMAYRAFRVGQYQEAEKYFEKVPLKDMPWENALAAIIHHHAGREEQARKCLNEFEEWYKKRPEEAIARAEYRAPFGGAFWAWGHLLLMRQNLPAWFPLAAPKDDPVRTAIEAHARKVWNDRDPATEAYDHALRVQPEVARLWFARAGRRLVLGRRAEAVADFRKGAELAGKEPVQKQFLQLYVELGGPEQAADAFAKYIDQLPKDERWMSARSAAVASFVPFHAAFDKLIKLRPGDMHLITCRGRDHLAHGRYAAAAADYRRVICERPIREDWVEAGESYLLSGDAASYQDLCAAMVEKAGDKPDPFACFVLARCGGLSANSGVEPARLIGWAKQALDSGQTSYYLHALGLAQYRAGDWEEAIKQLERSNALPWKEPDKAQNWLVLAMAHARAGRPEDAHRCLEQGRERIRMAAPLATAPQLSTYAGDWGEIQILLAEAEAVVEGKSANDSK